MITIWVPKRLVEIDLYNVAACSPQQLAQLSEHSYAQRVNYAAEKIRMSGAKIVMLTGPSASGKTTSAHCIAKALQKRGTPAQVVSLDNFFKGAEFYPRLPDGTLDYENPDTLDLPLIKQCLRELSETGKTVLPIYDFSAEKRSAEVEPIDLQGGVCIVEGIHALNPELTGLVKGDDIYRIYAGLREEYCIDGRRVINTLMLYGKQKHLMRMITEQVYRREKSNRLMTGILSHIVEFRNAESGPHVQHIQTVSELLLRQLARKTDRYTLTEDDISAGRTFPDVMVHRANFCFDTHNPAGGGQAESLEEARSTRPYDIPYRCFLPRGVENLLAAGRCISGTHKAHSSYRVMNICMAMGEAAGVAAALSATQGTSPRRLDVRKVQQVLMDGGVPLFD